MVKTSDNSSDTHLKKGIVKFTGYYNRINQHDSKNLLSKSYVHKCIFV